MEAVEEVVDKQREQEENRKEEETSFIKELNIKDNIIGIMYILVGVVLIGAAFELGEFVVEFITAGLLSIGGGSAVALK